MSGTPVAIAVVIARAAARAKALGPAAEQAVENLRAELEHNPRLGIRRGTRARGGEVYKTRIEPRPNMPGLAVSYLYLPEPPPPAVAIVTIVPDDAPEDDQP
ncbi:hypothetical protein ACWGQ5_49745 [Streptomyces sp. NPDC055722]